ncbi:MAG: holo-ACP synthase [Deltaproteobacteria bacterium]|nr:holo-ACP synthase [Deltaproteobacteria bacterium]MBW2019164.1 holo-ACP synthase [Deltaproteobacteria bacterium]MBW2073967.1 holo-ACP synthase [Deltaproteobacteria bacterium]RLB81229.1 MAG: 4'-phosphopantetheinyl transferase [Deltaproteobacteria bacterium]
MIFGIGIDMVKVSRVENAIKRWGDRFLKRVFTQAEIEYCHHRGHAASRFALRFAAKEAFSKALGLGFRKGLSLRHIEVLHGPNGRPHLSLHRKANELCERYGIKNSFLSLTDDGIYAVAVVVLEV